MTIEQKVYIREAMLKKRDELSLHDIKIMSEGIHKNILLLGELQTARKINCYLSKGSEVDTRSIIQSLINQNKYVTVPCIVADDIKITKFNGFDDLNIGRFGIPEPSKVTIELPDSMEAYIIPGLAFDMQKNRIGYGKGFYDDLLRGTKSVKIGICYDFQLIDEVTVEESDVKMDMIVTEKMVMR